MSTDKRNRLKKSIEILVVVVIIVISAIFGIDINQLIPNIVSGDDLQTLQMFTETQNVDGVLKIVMIDCGQGDSFLMTQNDMVALIDCGTRSTGKDVVNYLKKEGITRIDYLFGTHPHDDHMGGMFDVITNFEIGKVIIPKVNDVIITNWYIKLMDELNKDKYTITFPKVGDVYQFGEATIKVIGPISTDNITDYNNYSTVLKITFGKMDVIMTGDAEKSVEKQIVESGELIDAEILKVSHHGSDTSSSKEFVEAISPEYALISVGVGNKYNHPIKETMELFKKKKVTVYRTDECGTVIATITNDSVTFNCKPGDYLSGPELEKIKGEKQK